MKINYKIIIFTVFLICLGCFLFFKKYNSIDNIKDRAKKHCISNNHEYREVLNSDGTKTELCIVDENKIDIIEYYNNRNKYTIKK